MLNEPLWWLSFADEKSTQFLGVVLVHSGSFIAAVRKSHKLGINPGGQAVGALLDNRVANKLSSHTNKLLNREEAMKLCRVIESSLLN
jgi:hypothetical protein